MADKKKSRQEKETREYQARQSQMDLLFGKYAVLYKSMEHIYQDRIDRQRYVYEQIQEKGLENTDIERLLDMTAEDVQLQFTVKQNIENRVGFIIALWGIMVAAVLQLDIPIGLWNQFTGQIPIADNMAQIPVIIQIFSCMGLMFLLGCSLASLYFICKSLIAYKYAGPSFGNRDVNYYSAVDDKNIAIVRMLEVYTNIWDNNEDCNKRKARDLNRLIIIMVGFMISIVFAYIVNRFSL